MKKAGAYSDLGERALASEKKRPLEAVCATADDAVAYDRGRIGKGIQQDVDGHAEAETDKDDPPRSKNHPATSISAITSHE